MIPFKTPWLFKKAFPSFIWDIKSNEHKTIYLTFDDGPIPEVTPYVLDLLKKYGAEATFFCIGENIQKHPTIFKEIIQNGHAVGNHTFNHLNGKHSATQVYLENIKKCDHALKEHGIETDLFRPPYGRLKRPQRLQLKHKKVVMWDVLTRDYDRTLASEVCLQKSIKATQNGSIVLFHDSLKAEKNLKYALPKFLEHFASKKYSFSKLPL